MEAYKSTCEHCGQTYTWVGYKTGLGKTPEQLEKMRTDQTVCKYCGQSGLVTVLDEESELGQVSKAQNDLIVGVIAEMIGGPSKT